MKTEQITEAYALSSMQAGMLYHSLSVREPGVDVEQLFCTLPEALDAAAFERAWQRVVDRHAVLRTTFHWTDMAEPRQQVHAQAVIEFHFEDWRGKSAEEQKGLFEEALQADRRRGFNLSEKPPVRVALFRIGDSASRFIWTLHHLLLDGRAVVLVFNEVFAFYEAFVRGEDLELPPLRPFREYIDWLQQQDWSAAETFWRQTLKGFAMPTPLGVANGSSQECEPAMVRGEQEIGLSPSVTAKLKSLAKKNGLTPNTLLLGAWALLLSRYSLEDDVVFGVIRACRRSNVPNAGAIVGMLINTVPLRVRVVPELPLMSWLKTVREVWHALRDFEHTPLVNIQAASEVPRGQPLFESILNYQDPSWDAALCAQGGKWAERKFGIRSQSNYPLVVDAYGGQAMKIHILYHRNRFDDASITRMLGHFKTLLESMASMPDAQVARLPMLTTAEREQLLVKWNQTAVDFPGHKCAHELFEEQARRTPQALAVADEKQEWGYAELNERADLLAAELRKLGVGPDVCVGVCLERSVEMVAAKLAVWKAGGAYLPLDPSYPRERIAFMLEDAKVPALLTRARLRDQFKFEISNFKLLCLDDMGCQSARHEENETRGSDTTRGLPKNSTPDSKFPVPNSKNLAYVIYTSGSTGQPKGVEIEHRSLVNLITWHQRVYQVTPADRATQIATPSFDASVWELWPYLTCGASIHIPDEETRLEPQRLLRWLTKKEITFTFIPTPVAETMLAEPWPAENHVRVLLTGGDKLHRQPGKNVPCELANHYGPTESTVVATWIPVPSSENNANPPPIGRPIANTQVFILDKNLQPVPVGVSGELYIGGDGLARGYHNRADLTADKFIPNPFSAETGARLYKTGDLVRWLPDGAVEFLGRMDNQVKVRGQRIELGEIEAVLGRHTDVREAVVVPREDSKGETLLAAYVVLKGGVEWQPEILRDFLKLKLPDAMVPSAFVLLSALPLTPNGKVDRKALPAPAFTLETEFVAPRTPTEAKLVEIWREVLGAERIGVFDNFFELGGHSLKATQVISRLPGVFQVEILLRDLFDAATVAGLAEKIETVRGRGEPSAQPSLVHEAHDGEMPLSFAQERLWFLEQLEPGIALNNVPVAFQLEGKLNVGALGKALNEIVRRHETFRTVFKNQNGHPVAVIEVMNLLAVPVIDLSALPEDRRGAEVCRLMAEEGERAFSLEKSPLFRAKLLKIAPSCHILLLTTHHIACDGWSLGVLYRELATLYEAFSKDRPSPLRKGPVEYADFAKWQRGWLQGGEMEKQLTFWKQQLVGAQTTLDLPTDRPRPPVQVHHGTIKYFAFPQRLATTLNTVARQEDVTLFMLLLGALETLLSRYTGQEDILIGSPVAGRQLAEMEGLIGFFLNTLVLRSDLSGNPPFRELLQRVRQTTLDAYANQELPFEKLVDAIQPERDLSRSPLFQVLFVLQNEPLRPLELAGLKISPLPVHTGTAKFDLMLSLEESDTGLGGFIEYDTDLFDATTIERLIGHYQMLLEAISVDTTQRLSRLPMLTELERRQMLTDWNDTHVDFSRDKCIHELFEEQAKRTPDAVALVFEDEELTYGELDERAGQLAHKLQMLGAGPDVRVGICINRSLEMMVGLLGILKAGGAYVPLDPAYPKERLAFMLKDSQAPVLLTQTSLRDHFNSENLNLELLCVDEAQDTSSPTQPLTRSQLPATSLAYVIYTSGSTGQPKGVMVTHRNVVNFFAGMDRVLGTKPGVWLALTSISFDISALELFWTLVRGFKVVIQPGDDRARSAVFEGDGEQLGRLWSSPLEQILRHGITHMQCTPSLAGALVSAPESQAAMGSLKKLLVGGEALSVSLADQLHGVLRGELLNMYGPTETTIWSAVHRVEKFERSISIGRPIANTQIYILDKNLQPVPLGVSGKIFIGGEGVARGYLNRPELTVEKFVRNPFSAENCSRLYRTGDLGRWLPGGKIEFLGRVDHQVKIRGFRVELGEIEAALGRHPAVRECIVAVQEDPPGDKRLIAYVVAAPGMKPSTTVLRRFVREKLPQAMVPSAFVFLDKMPLTPNGKVNRKALPAPEKSRPEMETAYLAPRNDLERAIAGIWQELLHVETVGLHDNFFDLGGNSLLVVQAQARLREILGFDLRVAELFQYPTVSSLASHLGERGENPLEKARTRGSKKQAAFTQRKLEEIPA